MATVLGGMKFEGQLTGQAAVIARLYAIKQGPRNRILRKALRAGSKPILRLAKQLVPVRTRQMKKALGLALRTYTSGVVAAIIGVRKGFRVEIDGKFVDPTKYLHLVLFGRAEVKAGVGKSSHGAKVLSDGATFFGQTVAATKGDNFLQAAFDGAKAEAESAIARVVQEELAKLAAG